MAPVLTVLVLALALCAGCQEDGGDKGRQETPTVKKDPGGNLTYVALGDSYSSAPGVPETDMSNPCLRSSNNYPSMVADALSIRDFVDVTCGGATTKDMTTPQQEGTAPQLDALTPKTDLVTLGIGGNDSDVFFHAIYQCVMVASQDPDGSPCSDQSERSGVDLDAVLTTTQESIVKVVEEIQRRSPKARIILVGYPQLVPAQGACDALPLAAGDYEWARGVNRKLADAVAGAADTTETTYVDMWKASAGHDACADKPWVNGSSNNEFAAAFHPRIEEQEAAADLIVQQDRDKLP